MLRNKKKIGLASKAIKYIHTHNAATYTRYSLSLPITKKVKEIGLSNILIIHIILTVTEIALKHKVGEQEAKTT